MNKKMNLQDPEQIQGKKVLEWGLKKMKQNWEVAADFF